MGSVYSQLNIERRIIIEVLLRKGVSTSDVANVVKCHRVTVWREIARARARSGIDSYIAHFGQLHSERARRQAGLARRKLSSDLDSPAWQHLRAGLATRRSPQEIAGRLRLSFIMPGSHLQDSRYVSHETIYCAT